MTTPKALQEFLALPLPEGWNLEPVIGDRWISIHCPTGMCTVDIRSRIIRRGGYVTYGPSIDNIKHYTGRGWVRRLHADAVSLLQGH